MFGDPVRHERFVTVGKMGMKNGLHKRARRLFFCTLFYLKSSTIMQISIYMALNCNLYRTINF